MAPVYTKKRRLRQCDALRNNVLIGNLKTFMWMLLRHIPPTPTLLQTKVFSLNRIMHPTTLQKLIKTGLQNKVQGVA